jgi:DNA polymerase III epsilon subunit-like protein
LFKAKTGNRSLACRFYAIADFKTARKEDHPMPNEIRYAVVDTEGSGLFDYKQPADAPGQPRLASLSVLFVASDMSLERECHAFVKPDGWEMNEGATKVNGLTTEFLLANGKPVKEVLEVYRSAVMDDGRIIVAHNAQHDCKQIRAELRRAGLPDLFESTKNICTMRGLTDVCKIPPKGNRGGYKWPSLSEACVFFGFTEFGDHSAKNDAMACYMLLRKMKELGILGDGAVHYAKDRPLPPKEPIKAEEDF